MIVGEARIREITSGTSTEVWSKFGDELFLDKREFERYVGDRKERSMLVLVLENASKYTTPLRRNKPITKAGEYMTRQMYDKLKKEQNV